MAITWWIGKAVEDKEDYFWKNDVCHQIGKRSPQEQFSKGLHSILEDSKPNVTVHKDELWIHSDSGIGFYREPGMTLHEVGIELWEKNDKIVVRIERRVYIRERRRGRGIDLRKVFNAKRLGHFFKGPWVVGKAKEKSDEQANDQSSLSI